MRCQNAGARRKLMKPGPAISGVPASQPAGAAASSSGTSSSAIARGGRPSLRPRTRAALVERSPNSGFAGTSTENAGACFERRRLRLSPVPAALGLLLWLGLLALLLDELDEREVRGIALPDTELHHARVAPWRPSKRGAISSKSFFRMLRRRMTVAARRRAW